MPRYQFVCDNCNAAIEKNVPVDQRNDPLPCLDCGGGTERVRGSVTAITWA